jgi:hypothetical protein
MDLALIPHVRSLVPKKGFFDLTDPAVRIAYTGSDESILLLITELNREFCLATGKTIPVEQERGSQTKSIVIATVDQPSGAESYSLNIDNERITVDGQGSAGSFYGVQTLRQIVRSGGPRLPCMEIADSPDFIHRGFLHDVTRGKVPTLATLKLLVDSLAFYKINQLQLYVEHTFAFKSIPDLWSDKDPLTADEIRELDGYCRLRHIDLVPTLATFGHLYELLRLKRFEHLNELDINASELPHNLWDRMAHYTIDVSREESFLLIKKMLDEYLPLFSSSYCNLCCDETFDLGKGKNLERAREVGTGRLYVDFVKRLIGVATGHRKTPMLWGDIVLRYPELIGEFPDDTVFLNWAYGAEVTDEATAAFARAGVGQFVCPGVQGWSRFASEVNSATSNIRLMASYGRRYGAIGLLNTDWGDCGHVNFLANSLHGMALGAALAWNQDACDQDQLFDRAFSLLQWGDASGEIAALLRELGSLCFFHFGNLYAWVNNLDCLWNKGQEVHNFYPQPLVRNYERARAIEERFAKLAASSRYSNHYQDLAEFHWSAGAISWTLAILAFMKRNEFRQTGCPAVSGNSGDLAGEGAALLERFTRLWQARNKESELRNVIATFKKIIHRLDAQP